MDNLKLKVKIKYKIEKYDQNNQLIEVLEKEEEVPADELFITKKE